MNAVLARGKLVPVRAQRRVRVTLLLGWVLFLAAYAFALLVVALAPMV